MAKTAFIGLGVMGFPMAGHLARAGHAVTVFNRSPDKARRWDAHEAAQKSLPERKVVPKSAVRPLTSDGSGSSQPRPRFPGSATREAKGDWIARQILDEG